MSDRLRNQIAQERRQLNRLLDAHRPLLEKCAHSKPDTIELSALAAMLHSFYCGVENVFKRIAVEVDGESPEGPAWHRKLLESLFRPGAKRDGVISQGLYDRLGDYLEFRHVFRHAYSIELRWRKMAPLVLQCEDVLRQVERELDAFLAAMQEKEGPVQ